MEGTNETASGSNIEALTEYFDGVKAGNHTHIIPASDKFPEEVVGNIRRQFNGFALTELQGLMQYFAEKSGKHPKIVIVPDLENPGVTRAYVIFDHEGTEYALEIS